MGSDHLDRSQANLGGEASDIVDGLTGDHAAGVLRWMSGRQSP